MNLNIQELIPNTQMMHAIVAHIPTALSALGILCALAALLIRTRKEVLNWVAVAAYLILAASAYVGVRTGENARAELSASLPKSIMDIVSDHASMTEKIWIFALVTAVLIAISAFLNDRAKTVTAILGVVASLVTAVWVGLAVHHGGELVYGHGIGIPPDQVLEWRLNPPEGSTAAKAIPEEEWIPISEIDPVEAAKVSYLRDIVPIFEEVCIECHQPGDLDAELDMTTYEGLIIGGEKYGTTIVPGKPDESTTIKYVRGEYQPLMPEDDFPLTIKQVHTLRMWISAGAIDDSDAVEQ